MNGMPSRLTLIVTTYERPDALSAVLVSLVLQGQPPDELIIADDGSGEDTRAVIKRFGSIARCPVHHVWQDHEGFRAARARNLAIARATGDYLVFVDGDMLLHPAFITDHRRFARPGAFTQGVRILLNEQGTERVLRTPAYLPAIGDAGLGGLRRLYALHLPALSRATHRVANAFVAVKSCNLAAWREDLIATNGFNEDFVGWGPEDKELVARLEHAGVERQTLLFGGIAYHLHHPPAARDSASRNEAILAATLTRRLERCERGLDQHLPLH